MERQVDSPHRIGLRVDPHCVSGTLALRGFPANGVAVLVYRETESCVFESSRWTPQTSCELGLKMQWFALAQCRLSLCVLVGGVEANVTLNDR